MKLSFCEHAWNDYLYWQKADKKIVKRINLLIKYVQRSPNDGTGKPEPLKHALTGYWSRRINEEQRFVYNRGYRGTRGWTARMGFALIQMGDWCGSF